MAAPQEMTAQQLRGLVALNLVPGLGPRLTAALLERFGGPDEIMGAAPHELAEVPHIGEKLSRDMHEAFRRIDVTRELDLIARFKVQLSAIGSPDYPAPLANVGDAPPLLYMRGSYESRDVNAVALVGSRQCTSYGMRMAERLASDLVRAGFTVISGLARGIDGAAHRAALKAKGRTLAVLAGGLAKIYPPEHAELAFAVEEAGALFSEASMGMEPLAGMFPARNRIISGLSRGVVIVEAAERSGALITARHAAEQGRAVFAVPGSVDSPASSGCLQLIRDGATLIRNAEDIIEELDGSLSSHPTQRHTAPEPPPDLDETQQRIWELLAEQPRHVDELAQQSGSSVSALMSALLSLEMKKAVRRLAGNRYERL